MAPSKLNSTDSCEHGDDSISHMQPDNGYPDSNSLTHSEKAVQELLQQTPVQGTDEHLIEFSEALRTVAKALRRAAEGKAAAQAEAAEWKRRFELERARNLQLEHREQIQGECDGDFNERKIKNSANNNVMWNQTHERSKNCCMEHGICSHEVLRDGRTDSDSDSNMVNKMMRKMVERA